jgi:hypothetical protein
MTHIRVRKLIEKRTNYANREWWYEFEQLAQALSRRNATKRSQKLLQQFASLTKNWNSDLTRNGRYAYNFWCENGVGRVSNGAELRLRPPRTSVRCRPISNTTRSCIRFARYLFTNPNVVWNDGEILQATHSKTINVACSETAHFDRNLSEHVRKLFSSQSVPRVDFVSRPVEWRQVPQTRFDIYDYSRCFLEIAQFQSDCLRHRLRKNVTESFELDQEFTQHVIDVEIEGSTFTITKTGTGLDT